MTYSPLIPSSCLVVFLATLKIVPRHLTRDMTDLDISTIVTPSRPHFLSPFHQAVCHQGALQSPHQSAPNRVDGAKRATLDCTCKITSCLLCDNNGVCDNDDVWRYFFVYFVASTGSVDPVFAPSSLSYIDGHRGTWQKHTPLWNTCFVSIGARRGKVKQLSCDCVMRGRECIHINNIHDNNSCSLLEIGFRVQGIVIRVGGGRGDCLVTHRDVSVLRCCVATKVQLLAAVQGGPLRRNLYLYSQTAFYFTGGL